MLEKFKIRTKLVWVIVISILITVIIGTTNMIYNAKYNEVVLYGNYIVIEPLAHLSRIGFDFGQLRSAARDSMIGSKGGIISQSDIEYYMEDIQTQLQEYRLVLEQHNGMGNEEYDTVLKFQAGAGEWVADIAETIRLGKSGQPEESERYFYEETFPLGIQLNEYYNRLVDINREQGTWSITESERIMNHSLIVTVGMCLGSVVLLAVLLTRIMYSITRPLNYMVLTAKQVAEGKMDIDFAVDDWDTELAQLEKALKEVVQTVSSMIRDAEASIVAMQGGYFSQRIELSAYKGEYRHLIDEMNFSQMVISGHFDVLTSGIAFFNPKREITYANKALREILDYCGFEQDAPDVLTKMIEGNMPEERDKTANDVFEPSVTEGFAKQVVYKSTKDGGYRNYRLLLKGVKAKNGTTLCAIVMLKDITDLVEAVDEAKEASSAKTNFLSHMSHEIRTPMNAIIGMTQVARKTSNMDKMKDSINKIEGATHHLLSLVNDVLDMSKIEAGKLVLHEEEASISKNLHFVSSIISSKADERDVSVSLDIRIQNDFVFADTVRVNQVFINLMSNAIKFSPKAGVIKLIAEEIESNEECATYRFTVEDQGIGMTQQQMGRLFQSFTQADSSISGRYGGTGLGLVISKTIIEHMNGTIWVESELGKGSRFIFTMKLKIVQGDTQPKIDVPQGTDEVVDINEYVSSFDFSKYRALVVDDVELNRMIVMDLLEDTKLHMEEAANGKQAVEMFQDAPEGYFDLILMDMQMPEMDGCTATEVIRAMDRADAQSVVIIAMTANVFQSDVDKVLAAGMNGHIGKPFMVDAVVNQIYSMLKDRK